MKASRYGSSYPKESAAKPGLILPADVTDEFHRVELPDMMEDEWEEAKEWLAAEGFVHRVHGFPKRRPPVVTNSSQAGNGAVGYGAIFVSNKIVAHLNANNPSWNVPSGVTTVSFEMWCGGLETFAVSFLNENDALYFKMRWHG